MKPSSAGRSVTAAAIVNTTAITEAKAMPSKKLNRRTSRPSSAMHTVPPAKSTARPAVLSARTAATSDDMPALSPSPCLVTIKSA
jgi:hypothetical protein